MPDGKLTVVISAGQSRNPEKRELEKAVGVRAATLPGVRVLNIPHLYDLTPKGETFAALKNIDQDLVVLSWLYDRATHWILDRNGIRGQVGEVELKEEPDDEDQESTDEESTEQRVVDNQPRPERLIYCIDFRVSTQENDYLAEIQRIAEKHGCSKEAIASTPLTVEMLQRNTQPTNDTYVGATPSEARQVADNFSLFGLSSMATIDEHPGRRWYPVIDFSRCTNCMECIDFCLFGVYGVDSLETIVVEQADNCRKGCPACSRVCPQNAIIFPQHKTPAIAGAPVDASGMKIDLSKLFGAPESDEDALAVAARERDEQLLLAGRAAVGVEVGIRDRLSKKNEAKSDDLDDLIDQLDSLDL